MKKLSLTVITFWIICSPTIAYSNQSRSPAMLLPSTISNGSFKDECKFLKQAIELVLGEIAGSKTMHFTAIGSVMHSYKLDEQISVYKRLCD